MEICATLRWLRIDHRLVTGFSSFRDWAEGSATAWGSSNSADDTLTSSPDPSSVNDDIRTLRDVLHGASATRFDARQWLPEPAQILSRAFKFAPALMCIDTLVLTSVPTRSPRDEVAGCFRAFLEALAEMEAFSAEYRKRCGYTAGSTEAPPSSKPTLITQTLVLEVESSTQRPDAEHDVGGHLRDASKHDFSFFPDEKRSPIRPNENLTPKGVLPQKDEAGRATDDPGEDDFLSFLAKEVQM